MQKRRFAATAQAQHDIESFYAWPPSTHCLAQHSAQEITVDGFAEMLLTDHESDAADGAGGRADEQLQMDSVDALCVA